MKSQKTEATFFHCAILKIPDLLKSNTQSDRSTTPTGIKTQLSQALVRSNCLLVHEYGARFSK